MHKANFIKSDATMERHRADIFAWMLTNGYFVSEDENAVCPEHNSQVVPTMLRMHQCPACAKTHLKVVKAQQQPMVDAQVADWERRQKLTDAQREEEDRERAEERKRNKRKEIFSYA